MLSAFTVQIRKQSSLVSWSYSLVVPHFHRLGCHASVPLFWPNSRSQRQMDPIYCPCLPVLCSQTSITTAWYISSQGPVSYGLRTLKSSNYDIQRVFVCFCLFFNLVPESGLIHFWFHLSQSVLKRRWSKVKITKLKPTPTLINFWQDLEMNPFN